MAGIKTIQWKRKRTGRTNYKKRLTYLKSNKPRLVIRKTNTQIILQVIDYKPDGDRTICGVNSTSLKKLGWKLSYKNTPACYLAGLSLGKKALTKKVKEAVVDLGLQTPIKGSKLYAAVKGVIDAGLKINAEKEICPKEERITGKHIGEYLKKSEDKKQFNQYKKAGLQIEKQFEEVKKKI